MQDYLEPQQEISPMQQFYRDKCVFLTGATGFMGKVIVEKLLRTCSDIKSIYMLVRPKKGKVIETRFEEVLADPVFAILQKQYPNFAERLIPIAGDISQKGLGLKDEDRDTLIENVQVVFHAAATVRFNEKLRLATAINVQGTKELLTLCKQMKNLQSVIHVSTAYSNCPLKRVEEKFYSPPVQHDSLMKTVDSLEDRLLEAATPALLDTYPNTYTYTKAIAEDAVKDLGKDLPIAIFRPSTVLATWKEPVPGWIDNVYGPTGVVIGAGLGIIRTLHADKDVIADLVPVDLAVNCLLTVGWDTAINTRDCNEEVPIYNYVSSPEKPITHGRFMELNYKHGIQYPPVRAIWYYTLTLHRSRLIHQIFAFFLHLIPALLVDTALLAIGRQPQMLKVYEKIQKFSDVLSYFATREWEFANVNTQTLWKRMDTQDQKIFNFDIKSLDWENYFTTHAIGLRQYIAKDPLSTLPEARKRWFRFYILHRLIQCFFGFLLLRIMWSFVSYFLL